MAEPYPRPLVADESGRIWDLPGFRAAGAAGARIFPLDADNLIRLPYASELMSLPGRIPVALPLGGVTAVEVPDHPRVPGPLRPVAGFMAPGYTQTLTVPYLEEAGVGVLPLFAYAAVAWYRGSVRVAGVRIDRERRQDPRLMDLQAVRRNARRLRRELPGNRLVRHLQRCALEYGCPAALNFFLHRKEGPLPSSPRCNSACLGCISHQPDGRVPVTQPRIRFVPAPQELAEVGVLHLTRARRGVVSFGQGCEGEPLLVADVLEQAIRLIRSRTGRGTINLNTNASLPHAIGQLSKAGLQSVRVSLNSVRPVFYHRYYKPQGYDFGEVKESMRVAKSYGLFVSLNYLVMPGFTDCVEEVEALIGFLRTMPVDMIQWRNLNYDPGAYFSEFRDGFEGKPVGMRNLLWELKRRFPRLMHGYFNPPKEKWG